MEETGFSGQIREDRWQEGGDREQMTGGRNQGVELAKELWAELGLIPFTLLDDTPGMREILESHMGIIPLIFVYNYFLDKGVIESNDSVKITAKDKMPSNSTLAYRVELSSKGQKITIINTATQQATMIIEFWDQAGYSAKDSAYTISWTQLSTLTYNWKRLPHDPVWIKNFGGKVPANGMEITASEQHFSYELQAQSSTIEWLGFMIAKILMNPSEDLLKRFSLNTETLQTVTGIFLKAEAVFQNPQWLEDLRQWSEQNFSIIIYSAKYGRGLLTLNLGIINWDWSTMGVYNLTIA